MNHSSLPRTSSQTAAARLLAALACATVVACGGSATHSGSATTGGNVPGSGTPTGAGVGTGTGNALVSIEVLPASVSIAKGVTRALSATGHYADGSTQPLADVAWTTDRADVAALSGATVRGAGVGSTTVRASAGGITGSASVTVTPAVVIAVTISPAVASLAAGTHLAYEASAVFSDGTKQDVTASAAWAATPAAVATVTASGLATGLAVGAATVSASIGDVSASARLSVTDAVLAAVEVSPADPTVPVGVAQAFTATGLFSDGTRQDLTAVVTWSSADPTVATIAASGAATPVASGGTRVAATLGAVSGSTSLTVTDAILVSLAVDPPSAALAAGTPGALTATATYSDTTTQDVTTLVTWSSSDPAIAAVDAAGTVTGGVPGSATVTASFQGLTDSADVVVTPAVLVAVAITPASATIPKGLLEPLAATGTFSDGSTQDLTAAAAWTSSAPAVAAISNAAGLEGQVTAVDVGAATITASFGGLSATADLTVSGATIVSIAVSPATVRLPAGYGQQLRAVATYSDDSTRDVTAEATWTSSAPAIAAVSNAAGSTGLVTGVSASASDVEITAAIATPAGPVQGAASVTVVSASLQSIAVAPATFTVARRPTTRLAATGTFSGGIVLDVTRQCTWSSSARAVATVSKAGVVTGVATGTATIKARRGNKAGTASGTVE